MARAYANLAVLYINKGNVDEAARIYKKAIELKANSQYVISNYAPVLLGKNNLSKDEIVQAVYYAKSACEATGYLDSEMVLILAVAYNRAGNIDDALKMAERAEKLAVSANQRDMINLSRRNIQIYTELIKQKHAK